MATDGNGARERRVCHEYPDDGSLLEAVVRDGKLISCPDIRLYPLAKWGTGAMGLEAAIRFLQEIQEAIEETNPWRITPRPSIIRQLATLVRERFGFRRTPA